MWFGSTQDILYVVLAFCIVWFTVFLCWLLYQAARAVRNINRIIESVAEKLELITSAVEFIRKKVDGLSGAMGAVSSVVAGFAEKFIVSKISRSLGDKLSKGESKKSSKK